MRDDLTIGLVIAAEAIKRMHHKENIMSLLTIEQFTKILDMPESRAAVWYPQIVVAMDKFEINTPLRIAHFLAQVGHESGSFKYVKEIWTNSPAQQSYEGAARLGNTETGDGEKFLGRTPIQLTGHKNYKLFGDYIGVDFVSQSALLERIDYGALCCGWFWAIGAGQNLGRAALAALDKYDKGVGVNLNDIADADDIQTITLCVNGGLNGFEDRSRILLHGINIFGINAQLNNNLTWSKE